MHNHPPNPQGAEDVINRGAANGSEARLSWLLAGLAGMIGAVGNGTVFDWLGYLILYAAFLTGAALGGSLASRITGPQLILAAGLICGATTLATFFYTNRKPSPA